MRDVVVECRSIEMLRGGKLLHLLAPLQEQSVTLLPNEHRQLIEIAHGHLSWLRFECTLRAHWIDDNYVGL